MNPPTKAMVGPVGIFAKTERKIPINVVNIETIGVINSNWLRDLAYSREIADGIISRAFTKIIPTIETPSTIEIANNKW